MLLIPTAANPPARHFAIAGAAGKRRLAGREPLPPFHYVDKGSMATISRFSAVGDIGPLQFGGLRFAGFRPQPSRGATATALQAGDIGIGLLEITSGLLGTGQLTLLVDDLSLQPRENLVPVVRTDLVTRYGPRLTGPLGYPVVRQLQERFGRDSVAAMVRAVAAGDEVKVG